MKSHLIKYSQSLTIMKATNMMADSALVALPLLGRPFWKFHYRPILHYQILSYLSVSFPLRHAFCLVCFPLFLFFSFRANILLLDIKKKKILLLSCYIFRFILKHLYMCIIKYINIGTNTHIPSFSLSNISKAIKHTRNMLIHAD